MRRYEDVAPTMDARVSNLLGVSIFYATATGDYVEIFGFPIEVDPGDDAAAAPVDELPIRKRLKVDLAQIAQATGGREKPIVHDRIKCARLGEGIWRPASKKPRVAGRSVLFDVVRSVAVA